jgi:hypothetical protein
MKAAADKGSGRGTRPATATLTFAIALGLGMSSITTFGPAPAGHPHEVAAKMIAMGLRESRGESIDPQNEFLSF